jgi:hypothetical protein
MIKLRAMDEHKTLERELKAAEKKLGQDDPGLIPHLDKLAYFCHSHGQYSDAEALYVRSLQLREKHLPDDSDGMVRALHHLGMLMRVLNRFALSEPYYQQALLITRTTRGERDIETATRQNYLAGLYFAANRFADAQQLVASSLDIYEELFGGNHHLIGVTSMALALIYNRLGDDEGTLDYFKKADTLIGQSARGAAIETFSDIGAGLLLLARDKFKHGKPDEAETLFRYSVLIETNEIWPGHPIVAENVQLLADLYRSQTMAPEAEFLYRKAIEIRRAVLGAEHLDVAVSLYSLGTLLFDNRRYEDAETVLKEAIDIRSKAGFPPVLANSLKAYAATLRKLKREDEAVACEERAQKIWEKYNPVAK